jgi:hypothetical protein
MSAPTAEPVKPVPAKVTMTAEVVCGHCSFGIESEGGCFAALKLDDKTPVILKGKASEPLARATFDKKIFVVEGTLSLNKDKRMVLTLTSARERTDADKEKAPAAGTVRINGTVESKDGSLTIQNGEVPLALGDGKFAKPEANTLVEAAGKVVVKDGKVTLDVTSVEKK